jgi:hypothetical protein
MSMDGFVCFRVCKSLDAFVLVYVRVSRYLSTGGSAYLLV